MKKVIYELNKFYLGEAPYKEKIARTERVLKKHKLSFKDLEAEDSFSWACDSMAKDKNQLLGYLIDNGINLNHPNAIYGLVMFDDTKTMRFLLERGLNPNLLTSAEGGGEYPLIILAACNCNKKMIDLLIDYTANINAKICSKDNGFDKFGVLGYLYDATSYIDDEDYESETYQFNRSFKEAQEIIKYLHKKGVSLAAKHGDDNRTIEEIIEADEAQNKYRQLWKALVKKLRIADNKKIKGMGKL